MSDEEEYVTVGRRRYLKRSSRPLRRTATRTVRQTYKTPRSGTVLRAAFDAKKAHFDKDPRGREFMPDMVELAKIVRAVLDHERRKQAVRRK